VGRSHTGKRVSPGERRLKVDSQDGLPMPFFMQETSNLTKVRMKRKRRTKSRHDGEEVGIAVDLIEELFEKVNVTGRVPEDGDG